MNLKSFFTYWFCILLSTQLFGQLTKQEERKKRHTYLSIGVGTGKSTFRDFATSPLIYRSFPGSFLVNRIREDSSRSSTFEIKYTGGTYSSRVEKFKLGSAIGHIGQLHYQQLYQIKKWSNEIWNIKAGGAINYLQTVRINNALQNNAFGSEVFLNVLGILRASKNISREKFIEKKLLKFISYKRKPRKRELNLDLGIGVLNSTVRNGYAYIGQSSVLNKVPLLDNYEFKTLAGYRFRTNVEYKVYLENGNALALGYQWEAMKTGREIDTFELALHTVSLSLLFNTK